MRASRRSWLPVPGRIGSRAHTSTSGPYWAALRQAVQVVVFVQASWFEVVCSPVSTEPPLIPFVQRPASESGFSVRLKASTVGSGSAGATRLEGVADASFESPPSPFAFSADTL